MADNADAGSSEDLEQNAPVNEDTPAELDVSEESSADEAAPDDEVVDEPTVSELADEISDLKDQLLRKSADFDNYRKRMIREKEELGAYANRELLLDIVPIVDDFERAIRSSEESKDFDSFHNGVVLIEKQFISMLERKWKLVRFDSAGEEFDPERHEAMMTEESDDVEQPTVAEDFQKGYMLGERVIRPAKVKVAMPKASAESES